MASGPTDFIRNLGSSVSQLVDPRERADLVSVTTERATEAAVRGAFRELRRTFPELHDTLLQVRAALAQYIEEHRVAAQNGEPGPRLQRMAEGAVRGASTELRRVMPEIAGDIRRLGSEEAVDASAALQEASRAMVAGAMDGVAGGLRRASGALNRWSLPAAVIGISGLVAAVIVARSR